MTDVLAVGAHPDDFEVAMGGTAARLVDRLFFAHCRMEAPWDPFDFAVDVTEHYDRKMEAVAAFESVFEAVRYG